jgi:hypothetical protein
VGEARTGGIKYRGRRRRRRRRREVPGPTDHRAVRALQDRGTAARVARRRASPACWPGLIKDL